MYQDIRPKKLEELFGNKETVKSLKKLLKQDDRPHVYLLTGQRGTGKTTTARILAKELGCADIDFEELNGSDNRGIDDARRAIMLAHTSPIGGKCRVIVIDECFSVGTKILTLNGEKEIQFMKKDDFLFNLEGLSIVRNVFKNKILFDRVLRLDFSDGSTLFSTVDHLFFTDLGWEKASDLKKNLFLRKNCYILPDSNLQKKGIYYAKRWYTLLSENLHLLWKAICSKNIKSIKMRELLFTNYKMQILWKRVQSKKLFSKILFPKLCCNMAECSTGNQSKDVYRTEKIELQKKQKKVYKRKSGKIYGFLQNAFRTNEKEESNGEKRKYRENAFYKKIKWNFKYLVGKTWGEWKVYISSIVTCFCFRMENGNSCISWEKTNRLSNLLQTGFRKFNFENRDRGKWKGTQFEKQYFERLKKERNVKQVGLENITFYKRGNNEESFKSIIGNKERNQGFVEFYDLEVMGHPSYFANGFPVHNCHKMTGEAQNALLKVLEDTPKTTYFILCSTNPEKLLKTVRSRCTTFNFELLNEKIMQEFLETVLSYLDKDLDDKVFFGLIDCADGSPRDALVMLEQVVLLDTKEEQITLLKKTQVEHETIEICRILLKGGSWKSVVEIYKGIQDTEAETIRRTILGYMKTVLLSEQDEERQDMAYNVIRIFEKNVFDSGEAGVVSMLYESSKRR